jgi:hypothetical protein
MISAFPLQWPEGWPRTKAGFTKDGKFTKYKKDLTIADGVDRVIAELERFGIDRQDVVISTNVRTRLDGFPRSGEPTPQDKGVAVYWEEWNGKRRVIAVDIYTTVADNLAAIAATLDAMRAIERHGGAQILERAFTGFLALPAPTWKRPWREVMGFAPGEPVDAETLKARYRKLASTRHTDKEGGSDDAMAELNVANAEAEQEVGE